MAETTLTSPPPRPKSWLASLNRHLYSVAPPGLRFTPWKAWERVLFRFVFLFLILLVVPLDWKFYRDLFAVRWLHLHFYDLLHLSKYQPQFVPIAENNVPELGIASFVNWGIAALIAAVGAAVWGQL